MTPDLLEFITCMLVPSKGLCPGTSSRGWHEERMVWMPPFPHLIRCLSAYVVPTLWRGNEENEHVAEGPIDEETIRFFIFGDDPRDRVPSYKDLKNPSTEHQVRINAPF